LSKKKVKESNWKNKKFAQTQVMCKRINNIPVMWMRWTVENMIVIRVILLMQENLWEANMVGWIFIHRLRKFNFLMQYANRNAKATGKTTRRTATVPNWSCRKPQQSCRKELTVLSTPNMKISLWMSPCCDVRKPFKDHDVGQR
jgi:hypothetical protein